MLFFKLILTLSIIESSYVLINCASIDVSSITIDGQEIVIYEDEMTTEMSARTVGHAVASFEKFGGDSGKVAESLKTFMTKEFNSTWEVIVGKQFDAKITHLKGTYIGFSYLDHMVVVMRLLS